MSDYPARMGTNRRYPSAPSGPPAAPAVIQARPIGLTDDELDKTRQRLRHATTPIPIRAWVRYPEAATQVVGFALAWTRRAVYIEWQLPAGGIERLWVWASAVERMDLGAH